MSNPTTGTADPVLSKDEYAGESGSATHDHASHTNGTETHKRAKRWDYGGNPLARTNTGDSARFPAFGGDLQPGLYRPSHRKFGNPAPLGLSAFALTTFVLSLINVQARGVTTPNMVIAVAFGYGGLVQLLAGMWEMAVGNTFGATALSSYGGFWLSFAIALTPGGFEIASSYTKEDDFLSAFGFFLTGWFVFTTILLLCTLRSTVAFFLLFFFLDLAFLCLSIGYYYPVNGGADPRIIKAGGYFGLFAAFMAWYNALAGIADDTNSFFVIPVAHFPWSETGRARREKSDRETV